MLGVEVGVALDVEVSWVEAELDSLGDGFHDLLVFDDDCALGDVGGVDLSEDEVVDDVLGDGEDFLCVACGGWGFDDGHELEEDLAFGLF